MPIMEPKEVRTWMKLHAADYVDPKTGEVNATALAEGAASEFGNDEIGGPLDDETHWVWEFALKAAEAEEKNRE